MRANVGTGCPPYKLSESLGFTAYGREPRTLCVDGVFYDEILMALPLDAVE